MAEQRALNSRVAGSTPAGRAEGRHLVMAAFFVYDVYPKENVMWDDHKNDVWKMVLVVVGIMALIGTFTIVKASFKANAYRNVTGKHVSTWDAIWLDLRVQEPTEAAPVKSTSPATKKE